MPDSPETAGRDRLLALVQQWREEAAADRDPARHQDQTSGLARVTRERCASELAAVVRTIWP
jgi:hypothetical protein